MISLVHLIADLPDLCRNLLQVGIGLAFQSTLLLSVGLLAGRSLRRHGPAVSAFVYQAAVVALIVGALLAVPIGGHLGPLWCVSLPSAHDGPGRVPAPSTLSAQASTRNDVRRPTLAA